MQRKRTVKVAETTQVEKANKLLKKGWELNGIFLHSSHPNGYIMVLVKRETFEC